MVPRILVRHLVRLSAPAVFLLLLPPAGFAQSAVRGGGAADAAAVIVYLEGQDFEVRNPDGDLIESPDTIGRRLFEGDILITYDNTFVELQLLPSGNVLKVAENTDFRLESMERGRESRFAMLYGSVRARVGRLLNDEKFTIRGSSAVAGVRGTDFGMDVLVPRTGGAAEMVTRVYCFEGQVEVLPVESPAEAILLLMPEQMVTVPVRPAETPPEIVPLNPEIRTYWGLHPFLGRPAPEEPAPVVGPSRPAPASAGPPAAAVLFAELEAERRRSLTAGGFSMSLGMLFGSVGLLSHYMVDQGHPTGGRFDWDEAATLFTAAGSFYLTGSLLFFLNTARQGAEIRRLKAER